MKGFSFLVVVVALLASALVSVAPAEAAPSVGGSGTGHAVAARIVNVRDLPAVPRAGATPKAPKAPIPTSPDDTSQPKKPTTGNKPMPPSGRSSPSPRLASGTVASFNGIDEGSACGGGCNLGALTSAAVNGHEIMQVVGNAFQIFAEHGFRLPGTCGAVTSLASLLNSGSNFVNAARVQYDNRQRRFILTAVASTFGSTPAIWVAASTSDDACGAWFVYRITFSGPAWPTSSNILKLVPGQDGNALLIGIENFVPSGETYSVFGIAKSQLYFGSPVSFTTFAVPDAFAAPATNAGFPMIDTPVSYFVSAAADTGYKLYGLTHSGGPGAVLSQISTISAPFSGPTATRLINQPGTTARLNPADARGFFTSSPVTDGTRIWFAHEAGINGFPTVRQGAITIATNTVTAAFAYHSGTSDDYNPSIGVGLNPSGAETIYLNWAYTDAPAGVGTSNTVDSYVSTNGQVLPRTGTDVPVVNAGTTQVASAFGGFSSSVDIDPGVPDGSCAVGTQMFWRSFGWTTDVSKVGNC